LATPIAIRLTSGYKSALIEFILEQHAMSTRSHFYFGFYSYLEPLADGEGC
jgi:hypothetical protein